MSATGLDPDERPTLRHQITGKRVPTIRLAEFDLLMAKGGIEAVIEALRKEQVPNSPSD